LEKNEVFEFVRKMKARDHVILLYTDPKDKYEVLFGYLKAGLEKSEAAAYVASEETPEQVKEAMQEFGIDVKRYEQKGTLKIIDYRDWYIIGGKFDISKTISLWKSLLKDAEARGFKGLRVTGEMSCFFKHKMINELVEYEQALHRTLEIPLTAICAYNTEAITKEKGEIELLLDLIKAHSTVIIMGPKAGLVKTI